jgi:hypothetical protein
VVAATGLLDLSNLNNGTSAAVQPVNSLVLFDGFLLPTLPPPPPNQPPP